MISLIKFEDIQENYKLMYKWCNKPFVLEWFEQRNLSFKEIQTKYKNKLRNKIQDLFLITYENIKIGYLQIYKYSDNIKELSIYKDIYEYDIFIGEEDYLSKRIGSKIINYINKYIYENYRCNYILLRPFKRNIRAVKCYQKNNFKIITEYQDIDTVDNKEIIIVMLKER